jgi:hypothetical protein
MDIPQVKDRSALNTGMEISSANKPCQCSDYVICRSDGLAFLKYGPDKNISL